MKTSLRSFLPSAAIVAASILLAIPAPAARTPGGGGHGGGGHSSAPRVGGHTSGPRVSGSRGGSGSYRGSSGSYRGGYRPYRYRSYYRPYWGAGWWGWGGPYGWGWGYPYGYYGGSYLYSMESNYRGHFAVVDTDVSPDEAEVWLNGTYVGTADDFDGYPDYLYLEPGKYHVEFKLAGHESLSVDLDVKRGEKVELDKKLTRLAGHGKLDSFGPEKKGMPYGRVFGPDGKPVTSRNRSYERNDRDRHETRGEVREDRDDDDEDQLEVRERDDRDDHPAERPRERSDAPRVRASSERARLKFQVSPDDAAVYLDDRYVGAAEEISSSRRGIVTDPGKHIVTVMRPGYAAKTIDVEAKAGTAIDVVVELEK